MRNKYLLLLGVLLILLSGLTFAAPNVAAQDSDRTLKAAFIGGGGYEELYKLIPKFEEKTGIDVKIVAKMSHFALNEKITTVLSAGKTDIDVISVHTSFAPQWSEYLLDLKPYFSEEELNEFFSGVLESCVVNDKLIQIPRHVDARSLHYRKDLFEDPEEKEKFKEEYGYELQVPKNWKQLKDVAEFLTRPPSLYGFTFTGREEPIVGSWMELMRAAGGRFFDENYRPVFNSEPGQEALQLLVDLYKNMKVTPRGVPNNVWDDVASSFRNGNIAFYFEWPGWYGWMKNEEKSEVANKFGLALYPKGPAGKRSVWGAAHSFAVIDYAEYEGEIEDSVELVRFLTSKSSLRYEATKSGFLPARISVFDKLKEKAAKSDDPRDLERLKLLEKTYSEYFFPPPKIGEWGQIVSNIWPIFQKALTGQLSVNQTLDKAVETTEDIMEEAGYYD